MIRKKIDIKAREKFISEIVSKMTLEQKVGQCFTIHWGGSMITPYLVEAIEKLHIGGLRVTPFGQNSRRGKHYHQSLNYDYNYPAGYKKVKQNLFIPGSSNYVSPEQYAQRLNNLQTRAVAHNAGIPLHISIDQEGDISRDFSYGGINLFPSAMGLTATGDPQIAYEACKAVALQLSAIGITNIHSPVLDVNVDPRNPEINIRAYGDTPKIVAEYALASMKGFQDGGLVPTAKHFPGRGDSAIDAHAELPVVSGNMERLESVELYPYRMLIEHGLESVMLAHTAVPAVDPSMEISTVSKPIVTGLLREKLGFEGVITTDSITMGALMKKYGVGLACAKAIQAGCDLALNKTEDEFRDQGFCELKRLVENDQISEDQLTTSIKRILRMKYNLGMFDRFGQVDAEKSSEPIRDKKVIEISRQAAAKCITVIRDEENYLPLNPKTKVMVIEQQILAGYAGNDVYCHDKCFNEAMYEHSMNIVGLDTKFKATEADEEFVLEQIKSEKIELIVATNYYWRLCPSNNTALIRKLIAAGHKVVVVTNCPYELGAVPEAKAVVCNYGATPECSRAAANLLFGKAQSQGKWHLENFAWPEKSKTITSQTKLEAEENAVTGVVF
jgi:beta-N-acetylhexosaminidase